MKIADINFKLLTLCDDVKKNLDIIKNNDGPQEKKSIEAFHNLKRCSVDLCTISEHISSAANNFAWGRDNE